MSIHVAVPLLVIALMAPIAMAAPVEHESNAYSHCHDHNGQSDRYVSQNTSWSEAHTNDTVTWCNSEAWGGVLIRDHEGNDLASASASRSAWTFESTVEGWRAYRSDDGCAEFSCNYTGHLVSSGANRQKYDREEARVHTAATGTVLARTSECESQDYRQTETGWTAHENRDGYYAGNATGTRTTNHSFDGCEQETRLGGASASRSCRSSESDDRWTGTSWSKSGDHTESMDVDLRERDVRHDCVSRAGASHEVEGHAIAAGASRETHEWTHCESGFEQPYACESTASDDIVVRIDAAGASREVREPWPHA